MNFLRQMLLVKSKECIANYQNAIKCVEETEEMMKLTSVSYTHLYLVFVLQGEHGKISISVNSC